MRRRLTDRQRLRRNNAKQVARFGQKRGGDAFMYRQLTRLADVNPEVY